MVSWEGKEKIVLEGLRKGLTTLVNLLVALMVVYGVFLLCRECYIFCYEIFGPVVVEEAPGENKPFTVKNGETMYKVADSLDQDGIIVDKYTFYIRTKLMDQDKVVLKPGDYTLNTSMDYEDIINLLTFSE